MHTHVCVHVPYMSMRVRRGAGWAETPQDGSLSPFSLSSCQAYMRGGPWVFVPDLCRHKAMLLSYTCHERGENQMNILCLLYVEKKCYWRFPSSQLKNHPACPLPPTLRGWVAPWWPGHQPPAPAQPRARFPSVPCVLSGSVPAAPRDSAGQGTSSESLWQLLSVTVAKDTEPSRRPSFHSE